MFGLFGHCHPWESEMCNVIVPNVYELGDIVTARVEEGDELAEAMPEPPAPHPTPRRRTEAELRAEVLSPEHLRLHLPKNAYCKFCMEKHSKKTAPRRSRALELRRTAAERVSGQGGMRPHHCG